MKKNVLITVAIALYFFTGCEREEPDELIVSTDEIVALAGDSYSLKGTIVSAGGKEITSYGFCWSENPAPVVNANSVCLGSRISAGIFSCNLSIFEVNTTYFIRAYAMSEDKTCYGDEKSFTTPGVFPLTLMDIDHNIYNTVKIGSQTWMSENLKTTRYSDGTVIWRAEDEQAWYDLTLYSMAYCWYENYGALGATYGALYTWPAAMRVSSPEEIVAGRVQGVCPAGWHLPSDEEWKELEIHLGMSREEANTTGWRGGGEGGAMKHTGTVHWVSPNSGATNVSGFTALPAGWRDGAGTFKNLGTSTRFWSTGWYGNTAFVRQLDFNSSRIFRGTKGLYEGITVRCVKD